MSTFNAGDDFRKKFAEYESITVKIALFGQPGSGKSSIINRLTGQKLAAEGVKTDQTTGAKAYDWQGLHLVDLPGYGTQRFPAATYFDTFQVPTFDIFLCVFDGKFRDEDTEFFHRLRSIGKICLFVRNKVDSIWEEGKTIAQLKREIEKDLQTQVQSSEPVLFVSCRKKSGIDKLNRAIAGVLDEAKQERFYRDAKAYSEEFLNAKKKACEHHVALAAGASALNGLNPVPGVDIAVDITILVKLFSQLRSAFGLSDAILHDKRWMSKLTPVAGKVLQYVSREGIILLLKRFTAQVATKEISKWIPFVGQAIAASIGFGITNSAGHAYLNDCYVLAKALLDEDLGLSTDE